MVVALLWTASAPAALTAQTITGRLLDADTKDPIPGASVLLLDLEDRPLRLVLTDRYGRFSLEPAGAGRFRLRAERIGYRTATSAPFHVSRTDAVEVEFRLSIEAVALAPMTVVSRKHPHLEGVGFYVTDVLRQLRGVRARSRVARELASITLRRGCTPDIFVNGVPFRGLAGALDLDDRVSASTLVGVEVFTGFPLPMPYYERTPGAAVCGVIVLWTGPS